MFQISITTHLMISLPVMTTPPVAVPTKLMSDSEAEELLKKGGNLLHKIKNQSGGKDWKKNKKFLKPKD